jgi:SMODS-associated and fused to various effectors sensor domain
VKRKRNPDKEVRILEELFLCHSSTDALEIRVLAEELRLRGVVPWVDKNGGFQVGDESAGEAERAMDEDCFGLLFYATPEAFSSDFIRQVEVRRAVRRKEEDPTFVLFAVPRRMGFRELSERSIETLGIDLAAYSSQAMEDTDGKVEPVRKRLGVVADEVLDKVLRRACENGVPGTLQMQFSTREHLADEPGDVLRVDAVGMLKWASDLPSRHEAWGRVYEGLLNVKRRVSRHFGRSRLRVHGSKHLTAAFMLGYVYPSTVCQLEVRTKSGYWSTDCKPTSGDLLLTSISDGTVGSESLYVEISAGDKLVRDVVRRHVRRTRVSPLKYLRFTPGPGLEAAQYITNADACAIARQIRRELSRAISDYGISEIHVFAAVPQALATMLGHSMNAMPPIQLYEYDGRAYQLSHVLTPQP